MNSIRTMLRNWVSSCFQMNTPYPGGPPTPAKRNFPLDNDLLSAFYSDLFDLWMSKGRSEGVSISPFDQLIQYFRTGENSLSCCWSENCANIFIGIGPKGDVGQCECFVSQLSGIYIRQHPHLPGHGRHHEQSGTKAFPGAPLTPHGRRGLLRNASIWPFATADVPCGPTVRLEASSEKTPTVNPTKRSLDWPETLP